MVGVNKMNLNKNKLINAFIFIIIMLSVVGCSSETNDNFKLQTDYKLGTVVKIKVYDSNAEELLQDSFNIIDQIEAKMSSHLDSSEINLINQSAGKRKVQVSSDTYQVIKKAIEYAKLSQGFFDPTIGPLVKLWGIGTDSAKVPQQEQINNKLDLVNYKNIKLSKNNQIFLAKVGMKLDVGGIAKGYAADKIISYLKENDVESAFVDIGGNVSVLGSKTNGDLWTVGIQDPKKERGKVLAAVKVKDKTVVTSGNYERYFIKNGTRYHHLLNPETGYPARQGVISSTIIANKSFDADALSTAVYILGLEKGISLINNLDNVEAIVISSNNKIHITSEIKNNVQIFNKKDYKVVIE